MKLGTATYDTIIDPEIIPFGKHKGERADSVDHNYLTWCTNQEWIYEKHPEFMETVEHILLKAESENKHLGEFYSESDETLEEYKYAFANDVFDPDHD